MATVDDDPLWKDETEKNSPIKHVGTLLEGEAQCLGVSLST